LPNSPTPHMSQQGNRVTDEAVPQKPLDHCWNIWSNWFQKVDWIDLICSYCLPSLYYFSMISQKTICLWWKFVKWVTAS
jgi:hypothetical protein